MKKCFSCNTELEKNAKYCLNCGKKQKKINNGFLFILIVLVSIGGIALLEYVSSLLNIEETPINYIELNPQTINDDYINNKISAEKKYTGNYYYFKGNINKVESYLGSYYLTLMYNSNNDNINAIEFTAYFDNKNDLLKFNKGQEVTLYCRFENRTFENYFGTTVFSFKECKTND